MRNFNIMGVQWKIQFLVGAANKPIYRGELPKKGALGQFADLKGVGLPKKRGWCFWVGGDTPMQTMPRPQLIFSAPHTALTRASWKKYLIFRPVKIVHIFLWLKDENDTWGCWNLIFQHDNCLKKNRWIWCKHWHLFVFNQP